jgi:EpsI family protein
MNRRLLTISVILFLTLGVRMWVSAAPTIPTRTSLTEFPKAVQGWNQFREDVNSDEINNVLKADDYTLRSYRRSDGAAVDMFIAYYKVQRAGESMHSPRNCLPGWGYAILQNDEVELGRTATGKPAMINRYIVEKNGQRSLVLYWYQENGRVIANEYWGKIYLVWDALKTGRRDGAIVRFVSPIGKGQDLDAAMKPALELARAVAPELPKFLPN